MAAAAPLPKRGRRDDRGAGDLVYGRNAVREVILAGRRRVTHVWVVEGEAGRALE